MKLILKRSSSKKKKDKILYVKDKSKIEDYYNLTSTQEPNTDILHRLDSRMIGILGESDLVKCQSLLPKEQTFVTGFPMLLLTNSNTISHARNKIRTYSSTLVALLLTDRELFLVPLFLNSNQNQHMEISNRAKLYDVSSVQTGYLHSSSSSKSPSSTATENDVLISSIRTSPGQYSMKISFRHGSSWTLMTFSPSDTPEIQKERVLKIVATVNSMVRESLIQQKLEAHLSSSEKITIPNVYYKAGDLLIEGEILLTLQRLSFIQKSVRELNQKIAKKNKDNYSFSIDTISIYECKQSEQKCVKHYSSVILSSQGKSPDIKSSYLFCFPKQEVAEITNNIIRLITESQDIVDQIIMESQNHHYNNNNHSETSSVSSTSTTSSSNKPPRSLSNSNLSDSEFLLVDDIENFTDVGSSKEQETYVDEEEDVMITANSYQTKLDDQPTHHPTKVNFKVDSDILSTDEMLWVQSHLPLRHNDDILELAYSTNKHGISIKTFFSRLHNRSPCIMVIKDERGNVFGSFTADPWNTEKTIHYGSGESFLFKIKPERKKFPWTRINDDFMLSTKESFISLGSGGKGVGLWIDEELLYGSSNCCDTFHNDILSHNSDFKLLQLEVWSPLAKKSDQHAKMTNATDLFGTTFSYKPPTRRFNAFGL